MPSLIKEATFLILCLKTFENEVRKLGINRDSLIVVYDNIGAMNLL